MKFFFYRRGPTLAAALMACALSLGGCVGEEEDPGTVSGTASQDEKTLEAAWGLAMWVEEKKELMLGFLPGKPKAGELKRILEKKSLFMGTSSSVPMVQFSIRFAEKDGKPDPLSPENYVVVWKEFGKMPMTLNRSATTGGTQISGDLRRGGTVQGRFHGTDNWDMGEKQMSYRWNLNFELPVR